MSRRGRLAECRSCTLPIRFVQLGTGNKMPVNPKPNPAGNVATRLIGGQLHGRVVGARSRPAVPGEVLYMAHFATCDGRPKKQPAKAPAEPDAALF